MAIDDLIRKLSPRGAMLLNAARVLDSNIVNQSMTQRHKALSEAADGLPYFYLASSMIQEISRLVTFVDPIPYPIRSERHGFENQEFAFINGGPELVLVYGNTLVGDDVRVASSYGSENIVNESRLSYRMHDRQIVVDRLKSLYEFIRCAKDMWNARPFIPLNEKPMVGDLVYCHKYPYARFDIDKAALESFGNILDPTKRLGVVKSILDGVHEISSLDGETMWSGVEAKRNDHRIIVDKLELVLQKGWNEEMLSKPFISKEQYERLVGPAMMQFGGDPRAVAWHFRHGKMLQEQFIGLVRQGADGRRIVRIFTEDYGCGIDEILKLAGGDAKHLSVNAMNECEKIIRDASCFSEYARTLIDGVTGITGLGIDDLLSCTLDNPDFLGRKIMGVNQKGAAVTGYVREISGRGTASAYEDMHNPASLACIPVNRLKHVSPSEYMAASSLFELHLLADRLRDAACPSGNSQHAAEFLEDTLENIEKEVKKRFSRGRRDTKEELNVYDVIKNRLDSEVVGPLLSYGFDEGGVREMILAGSDDNPTIKKAIDGIFRYRNKEKYSPFKKSRHARLLLQTAMKTKDIKAVFRDMNQMVRNNPAEAETIMEAMTLIHAGLLKDDDSFAPIVEWLDAQAGGKKDYLDEHQLGCIIDNFRMLGGPSIGAHAYRQEQHAGCGVWSISDQRGYLLKISNTHIDYKRCARFLLEEILALNRDDIRNQEAIACLEGNEGISQFLRVYPKKESNYFVIHQDNTSNHDPSVAVMIGNIMNDSRWPLRHESEALGMLQRLRSSGIPVDAGFRYKLTEDSSGQYIVPFMEPIGDSHLFFLGKIDVRDNWMRSRRLRHRDEGLVDVDIEYLFISGAAVPYLSHGEVRCILENTARKVDKELGLHSETVFEYAGKITTKKIDVPKYLVLDP